jgi:hypothetical protein
MKESMVMIMKVHGTKSCEEEGTTDKRIGTRKLQLTIFAKNLRFHGEDKPSEPVVLLGLYCNISVNYR